jgi:hypothetical protein
MLNQHYKDYEIKKLIEKNGNFELVKAELKVIKTGKTKIGYLVEDRTEEKMKVELFFKEDKARRCFEKKNPA